MIVADLSRGVSFPLLWTAFLAARPEAFGELVDLVKQARDTSPLIDVFASALRADSDPLPALKDACRSFDPLPIRDLPGLKDADHSAIDALRELKLKNLDPFEFCAYIACTVFLKRQKTRWKILSPAINPDSDIKSFSLLRNETMILDTRAPFLSPLLAAFLSGQFHPFVTATGSVRCTAIETHTDPLAPNLVARLFHLEEQPIETDQVAVITANIDDMTPELLADAMRLILTSGALDCTVTQVVMKKGLSLIHI
mgnify:CR=1 FL=1